MNSTKSAVGSMNNSKNKLNNKKKMTFLSQYQTHTSVLRGFQTLNYI